MPTAHGASRPARRRSEARANEGFAVGGEDLDRNRKVRCVRRTGIRGQERTIWKFRRRDVRGIVRHEIGAPRPGTVEHGPVAMASEIGTLRYPDGLRRTIHRDELRVHVTSEHVGNFEIDRLQAMHGDPWIGQAPANPRAGGNDEHEFDDHRGIRHRDHVEFTARSRLPAGCRQAEGRDGPAATRQSGRTLPHVSADPAAAGFHAGRNPTWTCRRASPSPSGGHAGRPERFRSGASWTCGYDDFMFCTFQSLPGTRAHC